MEEHNRDTYSPTSGKVLALVALAMPKRGKRVRHVVVSKPYRFRGRMTKGLGVGGKYISHPYYSAEFEKILGCKPFPGTLNMETDTDWRELSSNCKPLVIKETVWNGKVLGAVYVWRARLVTSSGEYDGVVVIRPLKSAHRPQVLELVSCRKLRPLIGEEGEAEVLVDCDENPWYTVHERNSVK